MISGKVFVSAVKASMGAAIALTVMLVAAPASGIERAWDMLLERDDHGEPGDWCAYTPTDAKGWGASDGGFTVRDRATDRSIWFFGDTWSHDGGFTEATNPDGTPVTIYWKPNSILTTTSSGGAVPTSPQFYGRNGKTGAGNIYNLTSNGIPWTRPWMGYSGSLPYWTPAVKPWYWPGKSLIPQGTNTLYTFWDRVRCISSSEAYNACTNNAYSLRGYPMVCKFNNITGSARNWGEPSCVNLEDFQHNAPLDLGLVWGRAITDLGNGRFFVYGVTVDAQQHFGNVVLAMVTPDTVQDYKQWQFFTPSGFAKRENAITTPNDLAVIATTADSYFTVDFIQTAGKGAWLMTQGWGSAAMHLVIRTAADVTLGTKFPNIPFSSDSATLVKPLNGPLGIDPICQASPALSYHKTAQWDLSDQANKKLLVSYYCSLVKHDQDPQTSVAPIGCMSAPHWMQRGCDGDDCTTLPGRIRFYNQDLMKMHPWCTSNCDMP